MLNRMIESILLYRREMSVLHVQEMQELDRLKDVSYVFWMRMISGWKINWQKRWHICVLRMQALSLPGMNLQMKKV